MRRVVFGLAVALMAAVAASCGGAPARPTPQPGGGGNGGGNNGGNNGGSNPPANNPPVIESIAVQGTRLRQPANFADLGESIAVSAKVRDDETAVDQLVYTWTATSGTFSGTGATVTWRAPETAPLDVKGITPASVTITLAVTEKYGQPGGPLAFEHGVSQTAAVSLHNSVKEVGEMSRQFLLDFSDTNIKDADFIMRNFGKAGLCPEPGEVTSERTDVTRNFTEFKVVNSSVGQDATTVNFGGFCPVFGNRGDACSTVPVLWDSIKLSDGSRSFSSGNDIIAAAYSVPDKRWFLCASRYQVLKTIGAARSIR